MLVQKSFRLITGHYSLGAKNLAILFVHVSKVFSFAFENAELKKISFLKYFNTLLASVWKNKQRFAKMWHSLDFFCLLKISLFLSLSLSLSLSQTISLTHAHTLTLIWVTSRNNHMNVGDRSASNPLETFCPQAMKNKSLFLLPAWQHC